MAPMDVGLERDVCLDMLAEEVLEELSVIAAQSNSLYESATADISEGCAAVEAEDEALRTAQLVAYGWSSRQDEPTAPRHPGRLVRSHPLEFPMGIGDLHEDRPRTGRGP